MYRLGQVRKKKITKCVGGYFNLRIDIKLKTTRIAGACSKFIWRTHNTTCSVCIKNRDDNIVNKNFSTSKTCSLSCQQPHHCDSSTCKPIYFTALRTDILLYTIDKDFPSSIKKQKKNTWLSFSHALFVHHRANDPSRIFFGTTEFISIISYYTPWSKTNDAFWKHNVFIIWREHFRPKFNRSGGRRNTACRFRRRTRLITLLVSLVLYQHWRDATVGTRFDSCH